MTDIKTIKHLCKVVSVAKNAGIDALIVSYNMMVNTKLIDQLQQVWNQTDRRDVTKSM